MNQTYQTNLQYNGATAIAMPIPSILQPSLLEQKLYDVMGNIAQKEKESIVGSLNYLDGVVTAAATAFDNYQTGISASYLQEIGLLLFSKKRKAIEKQKKEADRAKSKSDKAKRMTPGDGSKYARKQNESLPLGLKDQRTEKDKEPKRTTQPYWTW